MRLVIFAILFLNSATSYAYNWKRCKKEVFFSGNGVGMFISTSSYFSSTGYCSALGQIEDQKKYFIAQNLEPLIMDSARGQGEYLNAYLSLSGCNQDGLQDAGRIVQKNFIKIYGEGLQNSPEQTYGQLQNIFNTDSVIKTSCKIKG